MKKTQLLSILLILLTVTYYGCTKGETGPAGATGATGNANVQSSNWVTLSMNFSSSDSAYEQTITADSLTQSIIDSGVVLTYIKVTSGSQTSFVNAENYLNPIIGIGAINLFSYYDYTGYSFRYVLIPSTSTLANGRVSESTIQGYTKDQWKQMSYDEVMTKLGNK